MFVANYPELHSARSDADFSRVINTLWNYASIGDDAITAHLGKSSADSEMSIVEWNWLSDTLLPIALRNYATAAIGSAFIHSSCFVGEGMSKTSPSFDMDTCYWSQGVIDEPLRVLSLARYWNAINYFYPYKMEMGISWDSILHSWIPRLVEDQSELDYDLNMIELCNSINDGHSSATSKLIYEQFYQGILPLKFEYVQGKTIVRGPRKIQGLDGDSAMKAWGLAPGNIVLNLDGKDIGSLRKEFARFAPHPNRPCTESSIDFLLALGKPGAVDKLTVLKGSALVTIPIRYEVFPRDGGEGEAPDEPVLKKIDENICYVNTCRLSVERIPVILDSLRSFQTLILDFRGAPQWSVYDIMPFLSKPTRFFRCKLPDLSAPGKLRELSGDEIGDHAIYAGKLIVLVNQKTGSSSEFTVMALQSIYGTKTVGSQTAGSDGDVTYLCLPGGIVTTFSGVGIYYLDGGPTQRVGIRVNVKVDPTIRGISEGRDEVLDRAIEMAKTQN